MEITLNYEGTRKMITLYGWDGFINIMNQLYTGNRFFTVSKSWFEDKEYNCKLKGEYGDMIIRWQVEA